MAHGDLIPDNLLIYWVGLSPGYFSVNDISKDPGNQQLYINQLERLVEEGELKRYGERRGWYAPVKKELVEMDFLHAPTNDTFMWLPFQLNNYIKIYPGNVFIFAGNKSSGKTALLLNIIKANMHDWDIRYFNSEMGAGELKDRLLKFPVKLSDWLFHAYERSANFDDVVFKGEGVLNIIDFLEVHDEFYKVGEKIKQIHNNLKGANAIIAIQKKGKQLLGRGAEMSLEVSRLYLSLDQGRATVVDAKNAKDPTKNLSGYSIEYNVWDGYRIDLYGEKKWGKEKR